MTHEHTHTHTCIIQFSWQILIFIVLCSHFRDGNDCSRMCAGGFFLFLFYFNLLAWIESFARRRVLEYPHMWRHALCTLIYIMLYGGLKGEKNGKEKLTKDIDFSFTTCLLDISLTLSEPRQSSSHIVFSWWSVNKNKEANLKGLLYCMWWKITRKEK